MIRYLPIAVTCVFAAGCAEAKLFCGPPGPSPDIVQAGFAAESAPFGESAYRLGCADVLEVTFKDQPSWDCFASVGIDGTVPLGPAGSANVEGRNLDEVRHTIAKQADVDPARLHVRVADPRSGRIYLAGPEANRHRVVPYQGPERVVEFLFRVGAMKQGSTDLSDVSVIRPNVAIGAATEVFRIDIEAVVLDGDPSTNVVLQPSDQVLVGETRRSRFSRLLPEWFRPLYRKLVGLLPPDGWPWKPAERDAARFTPGRG